MRSKPKIGDRGGQRAPAGQGTGAWLGMLEQGAHLLQDHAPLQGFNIYVTGFHCGKDEPQFQTEAHYYCRAVNDDVLQCVLFDGNSYDANLIGIEYIVSGRLFDTVPGYEKAYWHPHNYELLSGQLVAPGLPEAAEKALFKLLLNSYGKTWHTWHTSSSDGHPGTELPYGDPKLMWSFNRDGECDDGLRRNHAQAMDIDTAAKRADRQTFVEHAKPQHGVNAMKGVFPNSTAIPGVVDVEDGGDLHDEASGH